ncbi:MAG: hypothetical protein WD231_03385 [Candidatus Woykebacteria bacterium]
MDQNQIPVPISLTHLPKSQDNNPEIQADHPKKRLLLNKKISFAFLGLLITVGGAFIVVLPRAQTVRFAGSARESLSTSFTNLDSVNSSLNSLFKFATSSEDSVKLTKLTDTFEKFDLILGAITENGPEQKAEDANLGVRLSLLVRTLTGVFQNLEISEQGEVLFKEKVKGFTTPANDPRKLYRDQRDLATKVLSSVKSSENSLEILEKSLGKNQTPSSLSSLKKDLSDIRESSEKYTSEAEKTGNYYVLISDLSIELEGAFETFQLSLDSTNNVSSLVSSFDEASKSLKKLKGSLDSIPEKERPKGIADLHNDSIELFDLVIKYFDSLKVSAIKQDENAILDLSLKTSVKLNQLVLAGRDHEISFWKNNENLNSYDSLSDSHTKVLSQLEKTKEESNIFVLKFMGVR